MNKFSSFITNNKNKLLMLRLSLGIIFFLFGILKFIPKMSPAESLAEETIQVLSNHMISKHTGLILLAMIETIIGCLFITGKYLKFAIITGLFHMVFTFTPMFIFADPSISKMPFAFTMIDQYIMKNVVLMSALWLLWPTGQTLKKSHN